MSKFSVPGPLFLAHQDVIRLRPYVDARPKHTASLREAALKPGVWCDADEAAGFGYSPWGPATAAWYKTTAGWDKGGFRHKKDIYHETDL